MHRGGRRTSWQMSLGFFFHGRAGRGEKKAVLAFGGKWQRNRTWIRMQLKPKSRRRVLFLSHVFLPTNMTMKTPQPWDEIQKKNPTSPSKGEPQHIDNLFFSVLMCTLHCYSTTVKIYLTSPKTNNGKPTLRRCISYKKW